VRGGLVDEFSSLELKRGTKWCDAEGGLLLYAGIGSDDGADQFDAPLVFGATNPDPQPWATFQNTLYQGYQAGDNVSTPINNDGRAFQGRMPLKFFADLTYNDFELWARYTRSGSQLALSPSAGFHWNNGFGSWVTQNQTEVGHQQMTVQSKYETDLNEDLKLLAMVGWDSTEFARNLFNRTSDNFSEEELNSRIILTRDLGDNQIALGGEFYNDWFGQAGHLLDAPPSNDRLGANFFPWVNQTYSLMVEDQWQVNDEITTFVGGRWDKNSYTDWMYSPRAAVIYVPNKTTTWKVLLNRSQRMNVAEERRAQWLSNGTLSDPEILRSYELRLERSPTKCFSWAVSTFYIDLDAISWNQGASTSAITGNQEQWGFEGELFYRTQCWNFIASHSYTQLIDFTLLDPTATTFITAAPYGYGNDLAAWSDHITKLFIHRQLTCAWSVDSSLRYYWGFPGHADLVDRLRAIGTDSDAKAEPNWKRTFRDSVFLNVGLDYCYNPNVRFRVDGYNLLGLLERDLNKRIYYADHSFISEAPAIGLSGEVCY